jgi:hypothetical protein
MIAGWRIYLNLSEIVVKNLHIKRADNKQTSSVVAEKPIILKVSKFTLF